MAIPKTKNPKVTGLYTYDEATDTYVAWDGSVDASGSSITTEPLVDTPEFFEDTSFVTGDSPATLDINAALGRNATSAVIYNDGPGNFTVAISTDGSTFGDAVTMKSGEFLEYTDISIDSVKITWVADSAYRVQAI